MNIKFGDPIPVMGMPFGYAIDNFPDGTVECLVIDAIDSITGIARVSFCRVDFSKLEILDTYSSRLSYREQLRSALKAL